MINQVEKASDAAANIATTWAPIAAGVPPGTIPKLKDLKSITGLHAGEVPTEGAKVALANAILFKVVEVKVAQPGLYPILKPREIEKWLKIQTAVPGTDPDKTFETFLQNAKLPWIRPDMAFIPAPPFTMIGFNITTDIYLLPATEQAKQALSDGTIDGAGAASQEPSVDKLSADITSVLAKDVQSVGVSRPTANRNWWGIKVSHKTRAVPSGYDDASRKTLKDAIAAKVEGNGLKKGDYKIELPLSQPALDTLKTQINNAFLAKGNTDNHWELTKLEVEKEESHSFTYTKKGNPTLDETDAKKLITEMFDRFNQDNDAGSRTLKKE